MAKLTRESFDTLVHQLSEKRAESNWIKVGMSTCGIAAGAEDVLNTLTEEAKKRKIEIVIKRCGCQGMCSVEPLVEVHVPGLPDVVYGKVDKACAVKILEEHVIAKKLVNDHIYVLRTKR